MKGVFLDGSVFDRKDFSSLETVLDHWDFRETTSPNELIEVAYEADILLLNKTHFSKEVFEQLPNLKLICVSATGTDNVDLEAAKTHGVQVRNVVNYSTESVANLAMSMILSLTSRLEENRRLLVQGEWEKSTYPSLFKCAPLDLQNKTLGIIGYGAIGQEVERLATAFKMKTLISKNPKSDPSTLSVEELLPQVDMVSLHCPLTEYTTRLIGERELKLMRPEAILINVSRGKLVDSLALAKALKQNEIFGAGLDVLEQEPPPKDDPLLHLEHPRLLITPHIGWASKASIQKCVEILIGHVKEFVQSQTK